MPYSSTIILAVLPIQHTLSGTRLKINKYKIINCYCVLRSLDSPSTSMEMVTGSCATGTETLEGWDSDIDIEADPPDWTQNVEEQELRQLTSREKKRQGVINGN